MKKYDHYFLFLSCFYFFLFSSSAIPIKKFKLQSEKQFINFLSITENIQTSKQGEPHIAISTTNNLRGNQNWVGNVGIDFVVNVPIRILGLGAFDDNGDGFTSPKIVSIGKLFDQSVLSSVTFPVGLDQPLQQGYRWMYLKGKDILELPPGIYTIYASGFMGRDRLSNSSLSDADKHILDRLDETILFVGSGRYSSDSALFPSTIDNGPNDRYLAGSFMYDIGKCGDNHMDGGEECEWSFTPAFITTPDITNSMKYYTTQENSIAAKCFSQCEFDSLCAQAVYTPSLKVCQLSKTRVVLPPPPPPLPWPKDKPKCFPNSCTMESTSVYTVSMTAPANLIPDDAWHNVPELIKFLTVDQTSIFIVQYILTTTTDGGPLSTRMVINGEERATSRAVIHSPYYSSLQFTDFVSLKAGEYTIAVQYKTSKSGLSVAVESDQNSASLTVVQLNGDAYLFPSSILSSPPSIVADNYYYPFPLRFATPKMVESATFLAYYSVSGNSNGGHFVNRLMVDSVAQDHTLSLWGDATSGFTQAIWVGTLEPGMHTFEVQYQTPNSVTIDPSQYKNHKGVLSVLFLPPGTESQTLKVLNNFDIIADNVWRPIPSLSKKFTVTRPVTVMAFFLCSLGTQYSHIVMRLYLDGKPLSITQTLVGNTRYASASAFFFSDEIEIGTHEFVVYYRTPGSGVIYKPRELWHMCSFTTVIFPINVDNFQGITQLGWYKMCSAFCDIDNCANQEQSCVHGKCVDQFASFGCTCANGYGGKLCDRPQLTGMVTIDDAGELYINGESMVTFSGITTPTKFSVAANGGDILEIRGVNNQGKGGLAGYFDFGAVTFFADESWECSDNKGQSYSPAIYAKRENSPWKDLKPFTQLNPPMPDQVNAFITATSWDSSAFWCRTRIPVRAWLPGQRVQLALFTGLAQLCAYNMNTKTTYFGTVCSNGMVLWTSIFTADESTGNLRLCSWSREEREKANDDKFLSSYFGTCEKPPTVVPQLRPHKAIYFPALTEAKDPCDYFRLCHANAICLANPNGVFNCTCKPGFLGDGLKCEAIDGCYVSPCDPNALCQRTGPGTRVCKCIDGYEGNGTKCSLIDLCKPHPCNALATCIPSGPKSFTCSCPVGYTGDGIKVCQAINRCANIETCDRNADCYMNGTTPVCTCRVGYTGSGYFCSEINLCTDKPYPCHEKASCIKTGPGLYKCVCNQYYNGDGKYCEEIDPCKPSPCAKEATCKKAGLGKASCVCKKGYYGDGYSCVEINACNPNPCDPNAICSRTGPGTYSCTCNPGFRQSGDNCIAINACADRPCDKHAKCFATGAGTFSCTCFDGYAGDGLKCVAVNPCNTNPCDPNAFCTYLGPGKHSCTCKKGFKGDGMKCKVIEPCNPTPCDPHATCEPNGIDGFTCKCNRGYIPAATSVDLNNPTCAEENMCVPTKNACHKFATCIKTGPGLAICVCNEGYIGDGIGCQEIDNCAQFPPPCDQHATCTKVGPGKHECKCMAGYIGNGIQCHEQNICQEEHPCDDHATCNPTGPGTFQCICNKGYRGDGKTCEEIDNCERNPCGDNARCKKTGPGQSICECDKPGYSINPDGISCSEVDLCITRPCNVHAKCRKTAPGEYGCTCEDGYEGDGKVECREVDACLAGPCSQHARCTSIGPGRFNCQCFAGYIGSGFQCEEINMCLQRPCHIHATCKKTGPGTFSCACKPGYSGTGMICTEVNECVTGPCDPNAVCTPTGPGTYHCACRPGFRGDGFKCAEIQIDKKRTRNQDDNARKLKKLDAQVNLLSEDLDPLPSLTDDEEERIARINAEINHLKKAVQKILKNTDENTDNIMSLEAP